MTTARDEGFRWPAEWERHRATWLSWPHNPDTWPGCLAGAEEAFVAMARALHGREGLRVNVRSEAEAGRVRGLLAKEGVTEAVELLVIPTDDAWVRDHGPTFVVRPGELAVVDFGFDAWGRKYPPWERDAAVPRRIAEARGLRRFEPGFVLEGGSVDGDGEGTVLTTTQCLLHPNRLVEGEAPRTREGMEARLAAWLGAERVLWLGDGIEGDDTDGHVDDVARFVAPGVVVAAEQPDRADPDHAPLAENLTRLRAMRDARGRRLDVVALPMPPRLEAGGARCPASYANFYLANEVVLVPVFDAPQDARALAILRELLPGREVLGIPARTLVVGLGAVHCLTQQEPEPPPGR
jgi:agmatine deiminase